MRGGFSLVELLVVIGIIGVLVGIAVPATLAVRRSADGAVCASNMRQIGVALTGYASAHRGAFPPNSSEIKQYWYSQSVLGEAFPGGKQVVPGEMAGGVLVCPNDMDDSVRSYSMNVYASSYVSAPVRKKLEGEKPPGALFNATAKRASQLLLLAESWSELPSGTDVPPKHVSQAVIGLVGKPGERFGGGRGVIWTDPPDATANRFAPRPSQITFYRHRGSRGGQLEDPRGKANFLLADGHVEMVQQSALVRPDGKSSYQVLWSLVDEGVDQ